MQWIGEAWHGEARLGLVGRGIQWQVQAWCGTGRGVNLLRGDMSDTGYEVYGTALDLYYWTSLPGTGVEIRVVGLGRFEYRQAKGFATSSYKERVRTVGIRAADDGDWCYRGLNGALAELELPRATRAWNWKARITVTQPAGECPFRSRQDDVINLMGGIWSMGSRLAERDTWPESVRFPSEEDVVVFDLRHSSHYGDDLGWVIDQGENFAEQIRDTWQYWIREALGSPQINLLVEKRELEPVFLPD